MLALYSAIEGVSLRQDVAITGELTIQGRVRAVGSVPEKIYGARSIGVRKVLIPEENTRELPGELWGVEIVGIREIADALPHILMDPPLEVRG
jgi:ATP-dependent Lon protease